MVSFIYLKCVICVHEKKQQQQKPNKFLFIFNLLWFLLHFNAQYVSHKIGGGWRAHSDNALDPYNGASLLEGARGGEACYSSKEIGIHGQGGFGGGGGGCRTGGIIPYIL